MKKLSASAISFAKAYATMRNLSSDDTQVLLNYFALQYANAPLYVKFLLFCYFHFVALLCLCVNFKLLTKVESCQFENLCLLLTNSRVFLLGKLTISVRGLLEFKILEMEDTKCQKHLM